MGDVASRRTHERVNHESVLIVRCVRIGIIELRAGGLLLCQTQ